MKLFVYLFFFCSMSAQVSDYDKEIVKRKNSMMKNLDIKTYDSILEKNEDKSLSFLVRNKNTKEITIFTSFSNSEKILSCNKDETLVKSYINEKVFFSEIDSYEKEKISHPLFKYRYFMNNIENYMNFFVDEMFVKLNIEIPELVLSTNFETLNKKLIEYGVESAYKDFYFHLLLFGIKYFNEIDLNNGRVVLEHNNNYPLSFQPTFVDSKGNNYYFTFNVELAREMKSRFLGEDYAIDSDVDLNNPFDIKKILDLSLNKKWFINDTGNDKD
ncbi:hypothetical protein [Winogradskyella sp.]|uniref:hypothetical protein n=1 Tax=Winogradskyella sp. TaxID=1883156 RepID=UPI003BAC730A